MNKKSIKIKKKIKRKRGLSELVNTIVIVLIGIVAVSIIFTVTIDFFKQKSQISQAHIDLLEETVMMKKVLIDPLEPSKVQITFCCAQGKVIGSKTSSSGGNSETSSEKPLDIGLVIDRSDSMIQAGWTLEIDNSLSPVAKFENIEVEEDEYSEIVNFNILPGTERFAVLVEWAELEGYYGSKGSEFGPNIKSPSSNWEFGQNKPNLEDKVDPPSNLGIQDVYFSGISTLPEIVYVESPEEGEWQFRVYGLGFNPVNNLPPLQYVNITVYSGTEEELIRNPTVIALDAAKEASKDFVQIMGEEDRISVTMFAKDSILLNSLTTSKSTILNSIDSIAKQPDTQINEGIDVSKEDLVLNGRSDAEKIMILLTDGQNDEGPEPVIDSAQDAKNQGIKIYTIGLSGFVDEEMLKTVASDPSYYYFAPDASILENIFELVSERISQGRKISISLSDGFKVIFYNDTHSYSPDSSIIDLEPYQTKTYTFDLSGHLTNIKRIETYPIKIVNGQEIIGPLIQTYEF